MHPDRYLDDCLDDSDAFANKFSTVYCANEHSSFDCCDRVYQASPGDKRAKVTHDKSPQYIVELIQMKLCKACGPHEVSA